LLATYHDKNESIPGEVDALKNGHKSDAYILSNTRNTTSCDLWQYLMTHLKLANKSGPTSKYPSWDKWGKIRR
jgi:hypothetical protein